MAPGASPDSERSEASDVRFAPRNTIVSGVAQRPAAAGSCARAVAPNVSRATATQKRRVITTIYTEKGRQGPLTWTPPAPRGFPRAGRLRLRDAREHPEIELGPVARG